MKRLLCLILVILCSFKNDQLVERLSITGPLNFNGTRFDLAWTDKPRDNYYIQEYLPAGETVENFKQLLTAHVFALDMSIKDAVAQKVKELNVRKKTDGICHYVVTESPDGKESMIDFLLGESKGDMMTIAEFNVYRYRQVDLGNGKKGIFVYAYSKRAYGDDITAFLKSLGDDRNKLMNAMIDANVPVVWLNGQ